MPWGNPAALQGCQALAHRATNVRCMGTMTDARLAAMLSDLLLSGGAQTGRRRTPTAVDLDDDVVALVAERLDVVAPQRNRETDRSVTWALLIEAVTRAAAAPANDAKLLVAATHLLAIGTDPRDGNRPAPYDDTRALIATVGLNGATLHKRANLKVESVKYGTSVGLRRFYATLASQLGETVDTLRPDKHIESDNLGVAVGRAYQRLLGSDAAVSKLVQALVSVPELEEATLPRRRSKTLIWAGVGVAAVTVVTVGILLANGISGAAQGAAEASAPLATVESVASEPPKWTINTAFWVPASAPLEELEATTDGCFDSRAREWLQEYGVYRDQFLFKVRNVSGDTIGLSEVASRGATSPAQPGLIVKCSGGGEGGEIDWSVVALELGEDAVATLKNSTQVSDFFWRDMSAGETVGVMVYPSGEKDFTGTLTVDLSPTSGETSRLTVPELEGEDARLIEWHAMPSDKSVVFTLPSPDDLVSCKVNGAELDTCSAASLRAAIDELWGDE